MRYKSTLTTLLLILFSNTSFAFDLCDDCNEFPLVWGKVITISGGPGWVSAGKTQAIFRTPLQYNGYRAHKNSNTMGGGEIFFAVQRPIHPYLLGQIGINLAGAGNADLNGVVWVNNNPTLAWYRYKYHLNHARIALKGKVLFGKFLPRINPYLSGSFGVAFNHSFGFQTTPLTPLAPPVAAFTNNTQSFAFTYTLGAGISVPLNDSWRAEVGYDFADWGKSSLGAVPNQPYRHSLRLSNAFNHMVLFGISYLC